MRQKRRVTKLEAWSPVLRISNSKDSEWQWPGWKWRHWKWRGIYTWSKDDRTRLDVGEKKRSNEAFPKDWVAVSSRRMEKREERGCWWGESWKGLIRLPSLAVVHTRCLVQWCAGNCLMTLAKLWKEACRCCWNTFLLERMIQCSSQIMKLWVTLIAKFINSPGVLLILWLRAGPMPLLMQPEPQND